ncbi:DUF6366 family protein [Peribacillus frigoritolerans]|nr:DUF6366 family protein [Peribacillus frigoritolerans]MEB2630213.1 DUF6366 family protein [Peribacillus frigoritolerans]
MQEELKRNSSCSVHGGGLADLVGGLGWKGQVCSIRNHKRNEHLL